MASPGTDEKADELNDARADVGALRGMLRRTIRLVVVGRDGGRGWLRITSEETLVTSVVGEYSAPNGVTIAMNVVAAGDMFEDTVSGRRATTPEALLPLVIRDAPWDVA